MPRALTLYRVVAWIVSVLLVVLFCVGIPLKVTTGNDSVNAVAGIAHGVIFYPLYWIVTIYLAARVKMPMVRLLLTLLAGTIPFVSFYAEHETTRWVRDRPEAPVLQDQGAL